MVNGTEGTREPVRPIRPPVRPAPTPDPGAAADGPTVRGEPGSAGAALRPGQVLALQRQAGNSSVAHLLGRSSGPPVVQRVPSEFHPLVFERVDPVPLRVFGSHTQEWSIQNWRSAPKGSSFHWGYALETDGVAVLTGSTTADHGATTRVGLQARQPGTFSVQGTPVHQVPGGPQVTGDTRHARFVVAPPTLELVSTMPRKADGSGADSDHFSVGDRLVVRVRVGGVDGRHLQDPGAVVIDGATAADLVGPARPVQSFEDGRSYDVELQMTRPGSMDMSIELQIGDIVLGRGPKAQHVRATVEYDRQQFINLANQCQTRIDQAYTQTSSIMEVLSSAYGNAYDAHLSTLKAQDASNNLAADILLGAVLAFIPGGAGGVVGGFMKSASKSDFLVDAVKDLAKAGVRGVQGAAVAPLLDRGSGVMRPMQADPRTWRADYVVRVNQEKQTVLGELDRWLTGANSRAPGFAMDFDPLETMKAALTKNGTPIATTAVPDQKQSQRDFELGMWAAWLEAFAFTTVSGVNCGGAYTKVVENQGKKIRDRLNTLDVDGEAFMEEHGGVARRRAEQRVAESRR